MTYAPIILSAFGAAVSAAVAYHTKDYRLFSIVAAGIAVILLAVAIVAVTGDMSAPGGSLVNVEGCGNTIVRSNSGNVSTNAMCP